MATLLDGKKVSEEIKKELAAEVDELIRGGVEPCLAVALVGDDPASQKYVSNKEKACELVGICSIIERLPASTSQEELLELIGRWNMDKEINGILVQLPLPDHIGVEAIINAISPEKDIDGFGEDSPFDPCTPNGIIRLLKEYKIDLLDKKIVIFGRGRTVGKPLPGMLKREGVEDQNIVVIHSKTDPDEAINLAKQGDILISAVGKPKLITSDMIKQSAVVIDAGGDVDFEAVKEVASYITPISGGVGPMTIAMLMQNTVEATNWQAGLP